MSLANQLYSNGKKEFVNWEIYSFRESSQ